jgi:hypothetical protein
MLTLRTRNTLSFEPVIGEVSSRMPSGVTERVPSNGGSEAGSIYGPDLSAVVLD